MAATTDFDDMLASTVTIKVRTSFTKYGEPGWATSASTFKARWIEAPEEMRDDMGNVLQAKGILWIMSTGTITAEDQITLPDGTAPPILRVDRIFDENGVHHHRAYIGRDGRPVNL